MPYRRLMEKPLLTYDLTLRTYLPSNIYLLDVYLDVFCHFVTIVRDQRVGKERNGRCLKENQRKQSSMTRN